MNTIRIYLLFASLLATLPVFGQKLRYKNIYPNLKNADYRAAYLTIQAFVRQENTSPNAWYQLGLYNDKRADSFDPLKEGNLLITYADSAIYYYGLSKTLSDPKVIEKEKEFYEDFHEVDPNNEKKYSVSPEKVVAFLDERIAYFQEYRDNLAKSLVPFIASVRNYDQATKIFDELIEKYATLEELLMLADTDVVEKLDQLKVFSDSTQYYFKDFTRLTQAYPLKGYKQKAEIKTVDNYRLDGLVPRVDFLQENIVLWDYGTWVDEVKALLAGDIQNLRKAARELIKQAQVSLKQFDGSPEKYQALIPDRASVFLIEKYDYGSVITGLTRYYQSKVDYLIAAAARPDSNDRSRPLKLATLSNRTLQSTTQAQNSCEKLLEKSTPEAMAKHEALIKEVYQGRANFVSYTKQEKQFLQKERKKNQDLLLGQLLAEAERTVNPGRLAVYRRDTLSVCSEKQELPALADVVTYCHQEDIEGNMYLGGCKKSQGFTHGFVAKVDSSNKVKWFKLLDTEKDSTTISLVNTLSVSDDGCFLSLSKLSPSGDEVKSNTLLKMDGQGKILKEQVLDGFSLPVLMHYNIDAGQLGLATYGKSFGFTPAKNYPLDLWQFGDTLNLLWKTQEEIKGQLQALELIETDSSYLLLGNFSELTAKGLPKMQSKAGRDMKSTNIFITPVNKQGEVGKTQWFASEKAVYITKAFKVSQDHMYLLYREGSPKLPNYDWLKSLHGLIGVNSQGELLP